jgi:hypothetical protein
VSSFEQSFAQAIINRQVLESGTGRDNAVISKKKNGDKMFDPNKYSMGFCHGCNRLGKTINKDNFKIVCQVCGGFGLIKKQQRGVRTSGGWFQTKPSS